MYRAMIRTVGVGLLSAVVFMANSSVAEDTEARDLVKKVTEALPKEALSATMKLSSDQWPTRELQLSRKYMDKIHASFLEVKAPDALKGIRFLFLERPTGENEQYIKVAASNTAVRVADDVRKQPFLDSAFYVSDLIIPEVDRYNYKIIGEEEVLGRRCKLVESIPKNPANEIYGKTILALDPNDLLILRRQFFDKKGELLKVWTIEKVEKVDGVWTMLHQKMSNVQLKKEARVEITEVKYNVELSDKMFFPRYLSN